MLRFASFLGRLYFQYIIILAIGLIFAYILNSIFSIDDTGVRIMLSSIFLALFSSAVLLLGRARPVKPVKSMM